MESVKVLAKDETTTRVGGYLLVFGGKDLYGDYFTAETDFMPDLVPQPLLTYDHTLRAEKALNDPIGRIVKLSPDEKGLWVEAEIDMAHEYAEAVVDLIGKTEVGMSSGSVSHLVRGEMIGRVYKFTRWPIIEGALTTHPAEPRTRGVEFLKQHYPDVLKAMGQEVSAEAELPQVETMPAATQVKIILDEQDQQGEQTMPENAETNTALEGKVDALTTRVESILSYMQDSPALRSAGFFTQDGGSADPQVKSLGDFLLAIRRGDTKRLATVYGSTKAMNEDTGSAGGYLVPVDYNAQLLQVATQNSAILQRVNRIPVSTAMGKVPAIDHFTAPTAGSGNTAMAGNVKGAKRAEGGSYAETEAKITEVEWRVSDAISGVVPVSRELNADSPASIEALLRALIGIADGAKQEYYFLRGNGVGEPLGVLNADALVSVTVDTDNTFAYADAAEIVSRFKAINGGLWSWHPSIETDVAAFQTGSGGTAFVTDMSAPLRQQLLGYPTYKSEHQPKADNSGCVLLADWSAYLVFDRGGLEIDFSEHARFESGQVVWRFSRRLDGKPWFMNKITLADPQGSFTISPFVKLDD